MNNKRIDGVYMGKYVLYLDESETHTNGNYYFAIGGVIIEDTLLSSLDLQLNSLKSSLWQGDPNASSYILHEKEISEAQRSGHVNNTPYGIFRVNHNYRSLYAGLSMILQNNNLTTLGVCVDVQNLAHLYPGKTNSKLTIALQMLLENYCHFLGQHNATGDICYESLQEPGNQELRQRFYELEALGTLYYTPHFFQTHIGDIQFRSKSENLSGLQLADFIPNTFARKRANLSPKHVDFKKTVLRRAYDGSLSNRPKYGLKCIP